MNSDLKIEQASIEKILPYAKNARTHSAEQISQIAASIKEFGFNNPILISDDGRVIAGHGRLYAAQRLGLKSVPVAKLSHLSATQQRAYVLADNRLALNAGWDLSMLALELQELQISGVDPLLLGFDSDEVDRLISGLDATSGLTDEDDVSEVRPDPITKPGDVWLLGKHRLMCGDSTSIDAVETLMAGSKADLVFTDPPYNVAYSGRGQNKLGTIKNDDMSDADFGVFLREVFATCVAVMKPLACVYVCHPDSASAPKLAFEAAFAECFHKSSTIIWVKQSAGMGWQDYRAQHEPILYGWKEGDGKHFYCGDRAKTTVWQIGRDGQVTYKHPTQKPVLLPEEAIRNSSKGEDTVLDMFGGSGSTLIACEKTGREARLMELDAKYCDVIVRRWQNFTGKEATLESSGKSFNELAELENG